MKKDSPRFLDARFVVALVFVLFWCGAASAQIQTHDTTTYLVSAKAGKINGLSGKASVRQSGSQGIAGIQFAFQR